MGRQQSEHCQQAVVFTSVPNMLCTVAQGERERRKLRLFLNTHAQRRWEEQAERPICSALPHKSTAREASTVYLWNDALNVAGSTRQYAQNARTLTKDNSKKPEQSRFVETYPTSLGGAGWPKAKAPPEAPSDPSPNACPWDCRARGGNKEKISKGASMTLLRIA